MKRILTLCSLLLSIHSFTQDFILPDSITYGTDAPLNATAYFISNSPVCFGSAVDFTDLSYCATPPFGYITTWIWDFGDGTMDTITFPYNPSASHTYSYAAIFTVTLTVTDSYGFSDDYSASVTVYPNPVANFMFTPACDGQPVQFIDLSQTNGGGVIVSWEWNFGDPASGLGNTSNLQNPVHIFTGPGNYQVMLSITSSDGCSTDITKPVTVHPQSAGGSVSGSNTIVFGQNTGPLNLSGFTGSVIKWQKQNDGGGFADIPGTAGLTTYSEFPVYPGTWEYRASVQSGSCASQYSFPATVTVSDPPGGDSKTWTGASGDNWNEPGNWSPAGVPVSLDNIVIPVSVPNMPRVSINGLGCSDVTILRGATLTIDPDFTLTINGHLVME